MVLMMVVLAYDFVGLLNRFKSCSAYASTTTKDPLSSQHQNFARSSFLSCELVEGERTPSSQHSSDSRAPARAALAAQQSWAVAVG
jgi:hypothetical protein